LRYAILSDIHANLDALEAVLASVRAFGVDSCLCLGDVVGYGACPKECLDLVRDSCERTVAGNHDFAVLGRIDIENFNAYAKEATLWTKEALEESDLGYLGGLSLVENFDGFTIVHGALYSPELFDYVQTTYDASLSLNQLSNSVCFFGHSHIPVTFTQRRFISYSLAAEISVEPGTKVLVNVGSVGQPRDNNPQASYAVFDTAERRIWIRRVSYDVDMAATRIRDAGLPEVLGERLKVGR